MNELKWTTKVPTVQGWYWVKWKDGSKTLWFFEDSDGWDTHKLTKDADKFYGPLQPPEDDE